MLLPRRMEAVPMAKKAREKRKRTPKHVLKLPDLEQSKSAVLEMSLTSLKLTTDLRSRNQRIHRWYCSEPRLAFNKTVVTRYRIHPETEALRLDHYKPAFGCSPQTGRRGRRLRPAQRRPGGWNSPGGRVQNDWESPLAIGLVPNKASGCC